MPKNLKVRHLSCFILDFEWLSSSPIFFSTYSCHMHAELKVLLATKEELVTDLKIFMYHRTDEIKKLTKIKEDADR